MQIKFKRYTGTKGLLIKETTYCLEAMLLAAPEEHELIERYDRWREQVWILGHLDINSDQAEYKSQAMKVSMADLTRGARFEYTNFNNVMRTEDLITEAARQLLLTVRALATFDGTERVVEVDHRAAEVVEAG